MKISKTNDGKVSVKMTLSEWKKIGQDNNWLTAQSTPPPPFQPNSQPNPQPTAPTPKPRPKPIAEETMQYDGGNIEEEIAWHVNEVGENYLNIENDGIGSYEFWGQQGFDKGSDYEVFEGFSLAVDVTGSVFDEFHNPENFEETPSVSGNFTTSNGSDISWYGSSGSVKQINGRIWAIYNIVAN